MTFLIPKVGDRIVMLKSTLSANKGEMGTIANAYSLICKPDGTVIKDCYCVNFDEYNAGRHICDGSCEDGMDVGFP